MLYSVMKHYYVFIPFCVWFLVQTLKLCLDVKKRKTIKNPYQFLIVSGWFPSWHSALTSSALTIFFLVEGMDSLSFMVVAVFSALLRYDAMHVRYEAWRHGRALNDLHTALKDTHTPKNKNIFQERLWHTPVEVAWWVVLWSIFSVCLYYLFFSWISM